MVDWAAKRASATAKLAKVGFQGTITWKSDALDVDDPVQVEDVWVLPRERSVDEKGGKATITALVTTTEQAAENGILEFEDARYQINKLKQIGVGPGHLLSEVVASEL